MIFADGIDWKAFLPTYQDLQIEYGEQEVSIQAIEKKSDGAFVIRLDVPPGADKDDIDSKVMASYETNLKVLETKYRAELQAKNNEIEIYKKQSSDFLEIVKLQASRTINVEAKAVSSSESQGDRYDQRGSNIGIGHMSGGENKEVTGQKIVYPSKEKQTLAEAAEEIQNLLKQLEQNNPSPTESEMIAYINDETTPSFKRKAFAALRAAGETAIDEFFENPYVKVGKAAILAWIDA